VGQSAAIPRDVSKLSILLAFLALCAACAGASPGTPEDPREQAEVLRVGTSGDYPPFSSLDPGGERRGLDIELLRAYAADRGMRLEWVPFRWPGLQGDLEAGRFDLAVGGITVRPERSLAGRFTVPVARGGAVLLVPQAADSTPEPPGRGVRIAVNAGGHLERVARERLPEARVTAVPDNAAVLPELLSGRVDAALTDTFEAPLWIRRAERAGVALRAGAPLTRDHKAWWLRPGPGALARDLDRWLLEAERNGRLARARARHLGRPGPGAAEPLAALLAAADERLALMPAVAEVKRRRGLPVEVPDVEERVVASAAAEVERAARAAGRDAPEPEAVERFFRASIEAAKAVQHRVLAGPAAAGGGPPPDLESELRPALLRIGERLARLVVRLPQEPRSRAAVSEAAREALATHELPPAQLHALTRALADLSAAATASARLPLADAGDRRHQHQHVQSQPVPDPERQQELEGDEERERPALLQPEGEREARHAGGDVAGGVQHAVAHVAPGQGRLAEALDHEGRVLQHLPAALGPHGGQPARAGRQAPAQGPQQQEEDEPVAHVGEGVGVGQSLGVEAARHVAGPQPEALGGAPGRAPEGEQGRHRQGDGRQRGERDRATAPAGTQGPGVARRGAGAHV